jgi:hypothetical protein
MIPGRIVDAQPHETPKQQVELQPLHQLPFRADRVKYPQEHGSQQHLRRDRGTSHPGSVESREVRVQCCERHIRELPDRAQGMVGSDPSPPSPHRRTTSPTADPNPASAFPKRSREEVNHAQLGHATNFNSVQGASLLPIAPLPLGALPAALAVAGLFASDLAAAIPAAAATGVKARRTDSAPRPVMTLTCQEVVAVDQNQASDGIFRFALAALTDWIAPPSIFAICGREFFARLR